MPQTVSRAQRVLEVLREARELSTPGIVVSRARPEARVGRMVSVASRSQERTQSHTPHDPMASRSPAGRQFGASLPDPTPLVGRERELSALESLLEASSEGSRIVFIRGEGGVGKTRLAAELADRAAGRDWNVIRGRAYPMESGVPYAIFADAWLPTMQSLDPSALTVLSRGGETELRYLFPALRGGRNDPDDLAVGDPEEFRTRLMWNFAEFVKRYAARTPILCILEDLQWADDSSLQLVHFLARQSQGQPILIVCTYNDQHRDHCHQLVQTERSLESMRVGEVLRLDPLTMEHVTDLVRQTFGVDVDLIREFSAVLFGWTRGNAFFIEEILKSLIVSGQIRDKGGTWVGWDARDFDMPESIRDAIIGRVQSFSDAGRTVADLAAVIGGRASYTLLRSISGLEADQALSALEELCADGVLSEDSDEGHVVYGFRHPLVRQTLYDEFGLQRARILHGVVAEAMEEYYGANAADHVDELAFHFARTDGGKLRGKATKYLSMAGRKALDRRADLEAINYLEAALERGEGGDSNGNATLTEVLPLLARAHTHVGHFDTAALLWGSALEHVDKDSPEYLAIRRALGMTNVWRGRHEEARDHFQAGLEAARAANDAVATVRLLIAQANGLHELGQGTEALEILAEALPLAEKIGDPDLLARVHRALTLLHVWMGPPEKAIEHGRLAIELAQQIGGLSTEFWARWGLATLAGMRGDTDRMARDIDDLNDLADRARSPMLRLWIADMSVAFEYGQAEWDTGVARGEQAISLARSLNQRTLLPRLLIWTSQFYIARGELECAKDLIDEAVEMCGLDDEFGSIDVHQVVPTYIGLAHYLVALGDYEDAIDAAEKGLQIAEGTGYILWATHQLLPILGEACLWAGHIDRAEQVGRRLREHSDRIDHKIGSAWADACEAFVQWKRGDAAGAVDLMKASVEALEAIPQIWEATRIRRQLAGRLFEIGRREEALLELDRVHEVCVRVGAGLELEKTRVMYREMGVKPPPIATSGKPLGLTPTEKEVAILVAGGLTNEEIAKKTKRSTRTISTHLSNIYTKLGIGGAGARVRLGNLVREAGLLE